MSKKNQFWRELQLETVRGVLSVLQTAEKVRVYPSQKYPDLIMLKIQAKGTEFTGRLKPDEFELVKDALKPFTPTPDKKATVYTRDTSFAVKRYLQYAVTAVAIDGWHPAQGRAVSTWKAAMEMYNNQQALTLDAIDRADEIITIMREPEPSEYGRRLAQILTQEKTHIDSLPMLASAVIALDRRRAREAAQKASKHVGQPEQVYKADFLKVVYSKPVDTRRGEVMLYKLEDDQGNHYTCWYDDMEHDLPKRFAGDVLIVAHQEYQGVKETVIRVNPLLIRQLEICPACGGRYDLGECTCIAEPDNALWERKEDWDIEM